MAGGEHFLTGVVISQFYFGAGLRAALAPALPGDKLWAPSLGGMPTAQSGNFLRISAETLKVVRWTIHSLRNGHGRFLVSADSPI